jgi:hypothetical protein
MLDLVLVRDRLLEHPDCPLRDVRITGNVEQAMQESVQAPRAMLLDLGEEFRANPLYSGQVSQFVRAEFGVLLAVPDHARRDATSVLLEPRSYVRRSLLGWAPDPQGPLQAFEGRRGRLMGAGPVLWWLDIFSTEYIETGA